MLLGSLVITILPLIFGGFCHHCIARFDAHCIKVCKLQMVLQMQPQMPSLAAVLWQYCGPIPGACLVPIHPKHPQLEAARRAIALPTLATVSVISEMGH